MLSDADDVLRYRVSMFAFKRFSSSSTLLEIDANNQLCSDFNRRMTQEHHYHIEWKVSRKFLAGKTNDLIF